MESPKIKPGMWVQFHTGRGGKYWSKEAYLVEEIQPDGLIRLHGGKLRGEAALRLAPQDIPHATIQTKG